MFLRAFRVKDEVGKAVFRSQRDKVLTYSCGGSRCVTESILGKRGARVGVRDGLMSFFILFVFLLHAVAFSPVQVRKTHD